LPQFDPFGALTAAQRRELSRVASTRRFARGEKTWREQTPASTFMYVTHGSVKLVKHGFGGHDVILSIRGPGEILCSSAVCTHDDYCCEGIAVEDDTEVVSIPQQVLVGVLRQSDDALNAFLKTLGSPGRSLCQRLPDLLTCNVEQRVAVLFLRLADKRKIQLSDGRLRVPIPLSRQELADLCGTSVETLIRTMARFRDRGLVEDAAHGFILSSLQDLQEVTQTARRKERT
jgi:CRP/FNR family transcriptional regulator